MLGSLIGAGSSVLGGILGDKSTAKANKQNIKLQKEFAQHGVQWKVDDARRAGIHPLYALGAQTHSFSPSSVGGTSLASGLASAGQDISRAVAANSPQSTRDRMYADQVQALTLKRMGLENEVLASQIAKQRAQLGPALPTDGFDIKKGTDYIIGGKKMKANPDWSDAQEIAQRHGEPAEWLYFPFVTGADIKQNSPQFRDKVLRSKYFRPLYDWMGRR